MLDAFEAASIQPEQSAVQAALDKLHEGFKTTKAAYNGLYGSSSLDNLTTLARVVGLDQTMSIDAAGSLLNSTKELLYGTERNGTRTQGLVDISKHKLSKDYRTQNIKQQSGFSAEVLSTWKENLQAEAQGTGIKTYRADDRPDLFSRNDQYVDKIRVNENGEIIARIQSKFFGDNGKQWLQKMMSSKNEKYLLDGKVDKIECPKDYYDDVLKEIVEQRTSLETQIERLKDLGKLDVVEEKMARLDKLNTVEQMVEPSTVTRAEAISARLNPKGYVLSLIKSDIVAKANADGLAGGKAAAGITFATSAVSNISSYLDGKITSEELVTNVVCETAMAGALGYGTTFITSAVSTAMQATSSKMISTIGGTCLPAAVVSFAVESFDDVVNYAQGKIDGADLAFNLGDNATMVAAGLGGAKAGAFLGAAAGPAGIVFCGLVGGMVGCAVASQAYATAVEIGSEAMGYLADKVEQAAVMTVDAAGAADPNHVEIVRAALNDYFASNKLPFSA